MNIYTVNYILSRLSFAMAASLVIPLVLAIAANEPSRQAFMLSVLVSAFLGVGFRRYGKPAEALTAREGIAITAFGWFTGTFLGMLPYLLGNYLGFLDALFESISGFTGTGATVFSSLGTLPYSILFWRMMNKTLALHSIKRFAKLSKSGKRDFPSRTSSGIKNFSVSIFACRLRF